MTRTHQGAAPATKTTQQLVEDALKNIPGLAWNKPGRTRYDFRSDVITKPGFASLAAIACTSLDDDVWREDAATIEFEERIANLCGHESAIFCVSCTASNQLALRCLVSHPPSGLLCDAEAHVATHESGACSWLSGAMLQPVEASNGSYITLEDIKSNAILDSEDGRAPTRIIVLENTIAGTIVPLSVVQRISSWAKQNGILIHMDGARLWHAACLPGGPTLADYCRLCDTVSLDFSKIVGAPGGTMLLGNKQIIAKARQLRKAMGTIGQLGVMTSAAEAAFVEQFGYSHPNGNGVISRVHELTLRISEMWQNNGGYVTRSTQTNMVWIDLEHLKIGRKEFDERAETFGIKTDGPRLVLHHQIGEDAVIRLQRFLESLLEDVKLPPLPPLT